MTGFGSGSGNDGKLAVTLEMRAVNQRFLELNIRMPHAYLALEDRLRNGIKAILKRGKVDVFVTVQDLDPAAPDVRVDHAALGAVKMALQDVNDRFFEGKAVTLGDVTSLTRDWFVQTPWKPSMPMPAGRLLKPPCRVPWTAWSPCANGKGPISAGISSAGPIRWQPSSNPLPQPQENHRRAYEERLEKKILALMDKVRPPF